METREVERGMIGGFGDLQSADDLGLKADHDIFQFRCGDLIASVEHGAKAFIPFGGDVVTLIGSFDQRSMEHFLFERLLHVSLFAPLLGVSALFDRLHELGPAVEGGHHGVDAAHDPDPRHECRVGYRGQA